MSSFFVFFGHKYRLVMGCGASIIRTSTFPICSHKCHLVDRDISLLYSEKFSHDLQSNINGIKQCNANVAVSQLLSPELSSS